MNFNAGRDLHITDAELRAVLVDGIPIDRDFIFAFDEEQGWVDVVVPVRLRPCGIDIEEAPLRITGQVRALIRGRDS